MLIISAVLLSGIVISVLIINISRDSIRNEIFSRNFSQAELAAEYASSYALNVHNHLEAFAMRDDVRKAILGGNPESLQYLLSYISDSIEAIDATGIYDVTGIQLLASTPNAPTVGQSFDDREWFEQVMATGKPYLSPPVISRLTGNIVIPYGIPVCDEEGKVQALITGGLNLPILSEVITNINYGKHSRISLMDIRHGGIILANTNPERIMTPATGNNEAVNRMLAGESGSMEVTDSSGNQVLVGFTQVPGLPWGILVLTPSEQAFAVIDRLTLNAILATGLILLLTSVLGFIATRGVTRPLERLADSTRIIGSGDLDYPIAIDTNDEVGDVSRAISSMAQNLKKTLVSRDTLLAEIDNHKRTALALKSSLERFEHVAENANEFIWEIDPIGLFTYASPAVEKILGYTPDELAGCLYYYDLFAPAYLERGRKTAMEILESRSRFSQVTFRMLHKKGREVTLETNGQPVYNPSGELSGYRGLVQDITERNKAFEELARSQEFLTSLYNSLEEVIFTVDLPGRKIVYVNNAVEKVLGYKPQDCIGKNTLFLYTNDDEYRKFGSRLEQAIQKSEEQIVQVSHLINRAGEPLVGEISTTFLKQNGKPCQVISIVRDITQRLKNEKENEILRQKAEMASRLATVGEMAAGIAHEINNPLTGVIGFSELLLEEDLPPDVKDQLKIIAEGSNRVKGIVKRMLTFARQDGSHKNLLDIHDLLDSTLELRNYVLETAGIEVVKNYASGIPRIFADASQMQQVFMNIIVNAEQGIKKSQAQGTLTITTMLDSKFLSISFEDNGPGMTEEVISKIFNPFFTTKDPGEGTGLGLSLANSIILEHGGTIDIQSIPGKGSKFTVNLPLPGETDNTG